MKEKEKWRGGGVVEALSETIIILSLYHALKRSPLTFHRLSAIKTLKKKKLASLTKKQNSHSNKHSGLEIEQSIELFKSSIKYSRIFIFPDSFQTKANQFGNGQ